MLFNGVSRLDLGDSQEAFAMVNPLEERLPFVVPVKIREFKGCVEKWFLQVREDVHIL